MTADVGSSVAAATAAATVSPLLASWAVSLSDGVVDRWWRPRPLTLRQWLPVSAAAVVLAVLASTGHPPLAWWVLSVGGAVLSVVDIRTHRLPARFTRPLTGVIAVALCGAALITPDPTALIRAAAAAVVVAGGYLAIRFCSPSALGQGDVRTAAIAGGVVGYTGWVPVGQAQLLTVLLAGVTALILRCRPTVMTSRTGQVPLGPAIVVGAVLTVWL